MSPHAILIAALAVVLGLSVAYIKGRTDGGDLVRGEYATRDLADARTDQAAYAAWNARNRAKEQEAARKGQLAAKRYQAEIANAETAKIVALDSLRAGTLRLRLTDPAGCEAGGSPGSETAGTGRGDNGSSGGQFLGPTDASFLIAEASRADQVVAQLSSCQAVISADRNSGM